MDGGHRVLTFLVDANVLIDLGMVQGLDLLPRLDDSEVLDVVLLECKQPGSRFPSQELATLRKFLQC